LRAHFGLAVKDSIAGQVVHTGQPISFCQDSPSKIKTAYLVYALIYVPLRVGDEVIGVLGVDNRQNKRPFTQLHELLMSVLADYAVIAIENAKAFEATEQERKKLDATHHQHPGWRYPARPETEYSAYQPGGAQSLRHGNFRPDRTACRGCDCAYRLCRDVDFNQRESA